MNIAFNTLVENPDKPTGATVFFQKVLNELQRLERTNHYFLFVSPRNRHLFKIDQPNFHYVNCFISNERNLPRILISQIIIPVRLWQHKIDVYFSPQNISPFLILSKCKVVVYLYGTHHWQKSSGLGAIRTFYRKVLSLCAKSQTSIFVANSVSCKDDMVRYLRVPESRVRLVSEAFDHVLFSPRGLTPAEKERLRDHGLTEGRYILFVSMIYYYKNVHTLIDAFSKLRWQMNDPCDLVLVGRVDVRNTRKGTYLEKLQALTRKHQIEDKVKFLGFIPHEDLFPLYRGARLFVQPSLYETFGKPVIEAMACGVPVVGANAGATPEVMGGAGLLFDPNDSDDLCIKMHSLLTDEELYRNCVSKGLEHVRQFTFERQASGLMETLVAANSCRRSAQ